MRVVFFEDANAANFAPIALMRPVFELVCGTTTVRNRLLRRLAPDSWGALVRPELRDVYAEEYPDAIVNDTIAMQQEPTLLINGRWLCDAAALEGITADNAGIVGDDVAWLQIDAEEAMLLDRACPHEAILQIANSRNRVKATGSMLEYPWDLISHNPDMLRADFAEFHQRSVPETDNNVAILGDDISVASDVEIDPFVVFDTRSGPIRIESGVRIQAFTRIEGPSFVGRDSSLFRAHIRGGTTIGSVCRVGGEVEESVMHSYVNKYHDGFLGHSYVCPWVNIGAMSTTSDLKNDYSSVRVPLEGKPIETGFSKVGSFIGDHAKTAIDSMFNTGSSVGVMAVVLPGGPLIPKYVPSFGRVWFGQIADSWELDRCLETARRAMARRDCRLTAAQTRLLDHLYRRTANNRAAAVRSANERKSATR